MTIAKRTLSSIALVVFCHFVTGCNDNDGDQAAPIPSSGPPEAPDGYFNGTVLTGGDIYYGEALITEDGLVRVFDLGGTGAQFSGAGILFANRFVGNGVLIGEVCDNATQGPLCGQAIPATISFDATDRQVLRGEILAASGSQGAIRLDMGWHGTPETHYLQPAALDRISGTYAAGIPVPADSALNDMVAAIDDNGQLFVQSAATGCTGNGNLTPHLDAALGVYDVNLVLASCAPAYSDLNTELSGLATGFYQLGEEVGDPTGEGLAIWLSATHASQTPVAITLWAWRL